METFILSTPPPAGPPAPASGQGSQAASADAAASIAGLFLQILMTSCAAQAPGSGDPSEAQENGQEGDAPMKDVAEDPLSAGNPDAALLPAAGLPSFADAAPPIPAGTNSPEVLAADGSVDARPAADPPTAGAIPCTAGLPFPDPSSNLGAEGALPAGTAKPEAAPTGAPQASPAMRGADSSAAYSGAADSTSAPAAGAANDARPAQAAGFHDAAAGETDSGRIDPPSPALRETAPQDAPSVSGGKPSLASGEGDADAGSGAGNDPREPVHAAGTSGKKRIETAVRMEEPADPAASPAVAADRYAAAKASAPRSASAEPAAAQPPKTFQAGENAFVLTRKSDTSLEITLAPPGIGKLEIEVVLEKGVINANITAADPAGREAIERSLPQIIEMLTRDGLAVGGFTVSLKQRGNPEGNAQAAEFSGNAPVPPVAPAVVRAKAAPSGLVDLFV